MAATELSISMDTASMDAALASLAELAQTRRKVVQAFLDGIDSASQLCRVDLDGLSAPFAGEMRVALQPSDLLRDFLLAARTGEADGL